MLPFVTTFVDHSPSLLIPGVLSGGGKNCHW